MRNLMRYLTLGAIVCLCAGPAAVQAQTPDPQMVAPINKFLEAFNKGDIAAAAATHAAEADLTILDEVSPYLWRGPKAFEAWAGDLDADAKKRGITDQKVTLGAPTRVETNGADAYIVVPSVYAFKEGGVAMRESAQMTFVLKKGAAGWLIHGWTWTGPKARKATGAAKK
jgi:ketosteroid isomerase-like protein